MNEGLPVTGNVPVLASKVGIASLLGLLVASGELCPDCARATRAVDRRWRKCSACGRKFPRADKFRKVGK